MDEYVIGGERNIGVDHYNKLLMKFARFFATTKHGSQKWGTLPYTHHLLAVEQVLRRFNVTDGEVLTAAWLHDVVEDTDTSLKEIQESFGQHVRDLVAAVTNEKGENRKIRAALTYPKILATPRAVQLKLADRIANVEGGGALSDMYAKEHDSFRRNLYTPGQYEDMWTHLDGLFK